MTLYNFNIGGDLRILLFEKNIGQIYDEFDNFNAIEIIFESKNYCVKNEVQKVPIYKEHFII